MRVRDVFLTAVAAVVLFGIQGAQRCSAQSGLNCTGVWSGVVMASNGSSNAKLDVDMTQSNASVTGTARLTQTPTVVVGTVSGNVTTCEDLVIDFGSYGKMSATINVLGGIASGTYVQTGVGGDAAGSGVVALTLQQGVKTTSINGIYFGVDILSANNPGTTGAAFYILQTGNSLYVSTLWNGHRIYNGSGTIIGNSITFQLLQANLIVGLPNVMTGSATINNGVITGISFTSGGGSGDLASTAFTSTFFMPIGQ